MIIHRLRFEGEKHHQGFNWRTSEWDWLVNFLLGRFYIYIRYRKNAHPGIKNHGLKHWIFNWGFDF